MSEVILEQQTNRFYLTKQILPLRRRSLVSASVLYAYFCLMDLIRFPSELYVITIPVRLIFFLIPMTILAIVYLKKEPDNQSIHLFWLSYLYIAAGFIHCYLLYWVKKYDIPFPDSGFILIILYGCLLIALPVKVGALTSAAIMTGYAYVMNLVDYSLDEVVFNTFVYSFFAAMCLTINKYCQNVLKENFSLIKRLYNESIFDGMTQLYNRRHFDQQLKLLLHIGYRDKRELGLIFLDVDCFKHFNDTSGHIEADEVLKEIASCLKKVCRRDSDFATRYGGDEFVLVFYDIHEHELQNKCKAIIDAVRKLAIRHPKSSVSEFITVSLGATLVHSDKMSTCSKVIKVADENLYKAKGNGRNRYFIS
jgi:diguanylate cyclase (GGDEF)-like protein